MVYLTECIEMKKPIIGFTLDVEKPGGYSKFDWYAIRKNYLDAIEQLGGIAFPLSHNLKNIESCIKNRTDLYNRKLNFEKILITKEFPSYLSENKDKYANWIAK